MCLQPLKHIERVANTRDVKDVHGVVLECRVTNCRQHQRRCPVKAAVHDTAMRAATCARRYHRQIQLQAASASGTETDAFDVKRQSYSTTSRLCGFDFRRRKHKEMFHYDRGRVGSSMYFPLTHEHVFTRQVCDNAIKSTIDAPNGEFTRLAVRDCDGD